MTAVGIRIVVSKLGTQGYVKVLDSETGREIAGVGDISIQVPVGGPAKATMTVLVDSLDIDAEGLLTPVGLKDVLAGEPEPC